MALAFGGIVDPHSLDGYTQNLSLISISTLVRYFLGLSFIPVIPVQMYAFLKKKPKMNMTPCLINLGLLMFCAVLVHGHYTMELIKISHHSDLAKVLINARYGNDNKLKRHLQETMYIKETHRAFSPDGEFELRPDEGSSRHVIVRFHNQECEFTMAHWIIHAQEVYWLIDKKTRDYYIVYEWHYDQDDWEKVYITNLTTKKTALLCKGRLELDG